MAEDKGRFIVIEGADGTGKSTVSALLSEYLTKSGIDNIVTRHPGSTAVGAELRRINKQMEGIPPVAEGLIMAADNSAFIESILKPALSVGKWVIGDRNNYISSLLYQVVSGASFDQLDKIHEATLSSGSPKIDVLFILRADKKSRDTRKAIKTSTHYRDEKDKHDRFEANDDYVEKVARGYERLMEEQHARLLKFVEPTTEVPEPSPRVFYINADRAVGAVLDDITGTLTALFDCAENAKSS